MPVPARGRSMELLVRCLVPSLIFLSLAGCATPQRPVAVAAPVVVAPPPRAEAWKAIANAEDKYRLAHTVQAWSGGLADARTQGFGADIKKEGALLDPVAAQPKPAPTPGSYSCRKVQLGSTKAKEPAFERFKPFFCYVQAEGDLLVIVKQTGSQRPAGRLWEDDKDTRLIYLGSLALGDEEAPKAYGDDRTRDMAGVFERIGPFVWRLVIPWPRSNSKLDVFELTPVTDQPKVAGK